jgi:hypothetical protein
MRFFIAILFLSTTAFGGIPVQKNFFTKTFFGECPAKPTGDLALTLVKTFERTSSLREVKKEVIERKIKEKYFISSYTINYNPLEKILSLSFDCPEPLMKVDIYDPQKETPYRGVLVSTGEIYNPLYLDFLKKDGKLNREIPSLAMPVKFIDKKIQKKISLLVKEMPANIREKIAEVIIDDNFELTLILSLNSRPSSAFFGKDQWGLKVEKLSKIVDYMIANKKIPTIINLTNVQKVVVKFAQGS